CPRTAPQETEHHRRRARTDSERKGRPAPTIDHRPGSIRHIPQRHQEPAQPDRTAINTGRATRNVCPRRTASREVVENGEFTTEHTEITEKENAEPNGTVCRLDFFRVFRVFRSFMNNCGSPRNTRKSRKRKMQNRMEPCVAWISSVFSVCSVV